MSAWSPHRHWGYTLSGPNPWLSKAHFLLSLAHSWKCWDFIPWMLNDQFKQRSSSRYSLVNLHQIMLIGLGTWGSSLGNLPNSLSALAAQVSDSHKLDLEWKSQHDLSTTGSWIEPRLEQKLTGRVMLTGTLSCICPRLRTLWFRHSFCEDLPKTSVPWTWKWTVPSSVSSTHGRSSLIFWVQ